MSTNKASQVKFVLGIIAMTSVAALTPAANAKTLESSSVLQNIMSQAKLSLDSPMQQLNKPLATPSLEKLEGATKLAKANDDNSTNSGCTNSSC